MQRKTVAEIINEIDYFKSNNFDHKDKVAWIQDIVERRQKEIIDTHENPDGIQGGQ